MFQTLPQNEYPLPLTVAIALAGRYKIQVIRTAFKHDISLANEMFFLILLHQEQETTIYSSTQISGHNVLLM